MTEAYFETVVMPDERFRIKSFISDKFEHVIAVHPHWHDEIEILYVEDGNAAQQVNDKYFMMETGDIIIVGKGQLHSTYSYQNSSCRIHVVMFDPSGLLGTEALKEDEWSSELFGSNMSFNNPIKAGSVLYTELRKAILELQGELACRQKGYKNMVRSHLHHIAGILTRGEMYRIENGSGKDMRFTRKVLERTFNLIDESYFEKLSLKDAALASNLSTPHFCRLFKKATGMTFNAYLAFYRVNRAEKLLTTDMTLAAIAMECGFGSFSSFIRCFRKYKNCTPSASRKK